MADNLTELFNNTTPGLVPVTMMTSSSMTSTVTSSESLTTSIPDVRRWDDATWILTSAFIIFTMQSGFGLLESGSASRKNEVNIMVKNAVDVLFGGLSYWMFGFGLSFGEDEGTNTFVGVGYFFVDTARNEHDTGHLFSLFFFQASFATTATTIVSGSMAERTKLESYILFSFLNTFIYSIPAHWIWSAKYGWLKHLGATDIAGASAVHLVGGLTGLVATLMLGPRTGRFDREGEAPKMSSPTNAIFGLFMLWWGWLGFNCGSTYGITQKKWVLATRSAVATITSSIGGGMVGIAFSYITKHGKFDIVYLIDGILGSLVSITAYCALARPWEGLIIGAVGGLITCLGVPLIEKLKIDDPVGVIPVHFIASVWGMITVGLFGTKDHLEGFLQLDGLFRGGGFKLLLVQLLAVGVIALWTVVTSFITLKILDLTIGLRVPLHEEILGADIVEHSINGSYDKGSGDWCDENGKLVMTVDMSDRLCYENSIQQLRYHMREDVPENNWARRRSFMGFARGSDRRTSMRGSWETYGRAIASGDGDKGSGRSDRSSGFVSTEESPRVNTISVPNLRASPPPPPIEEDTDDLEVIVLADRERDGECGNFKRVYRRERNHTIVLSRK